METGSCDSQKPGWTPWPMVDSVPSPPGLGSFLLAIHLPHGNWEPKGTGHFLEGALGGESWGFSGVGGSLHRGTKA